MQPFCQAVEYYHCRALPQVILSADGDILIKFVRALFVVEDCKQSTRAEACQRCLSEAISQGIYLEPKPARRSWERAPSKVEDSLRRAKDYMRTCFDLAQDGLAPTILEKLLDTPPETQKYAREVLFPMLEFCPDRLAATEQYAQLQSAALSWHLDWIKAGCDNSSVNWAIGRLLSVAALGGRSELIPSLCATFLFLSIVYATHLLLESFLLWKRCVFRPQT